jgi:hypothetical protein
MHRVLGEEYVAIGLMSTTGHTAEMRRDEDAPFGFTIDDTPLGPPEPGGIEAAFADAGLELSIADLRRAQPEGAGSAGPAPDPDRIRIQGAYLRTPVLEAFDAVLNTGTSTVADGLESMRRADGAGGEAEKRTPGAGPGATQAAAEAGEVERARRPFRPQRGRGASRAGR